MDAEEFLREHPDITEDYLLKRINKCAPKVLDWLNGYLRKATIQLALYNFPPFLDYHKVTGEQLIEIAKKKPEDIRSMLSVFRHHIMLDGKSSYTAYGTVSYVRSFLSYYGVQLKVGKNLLARVPEHEEYYTLTNDQVQKIVQYAPIARDKAVIAFLYQAGQRDAIFEALKVGHVREEIEQGKRPAVIKIPANFKTCRGRSANKLGKDYYMVIPFETCTFIKAMIEERKRWGEEITDDSWLFRTYSVKLAGHPIKVNRSTPAKQAMTKKTVGKIIDHCTKAIGIFAQHTKRKLIHPHTFRRCFETTLDDKLSESLLKFIMGRAIPLEVAHHIPSELRGAYKIYSKEYVREQWNKNDCDMALNLGTSPKLMEAYKIVDGMKTSGMSEEEINEVYALIGALGSPEEAMKEIRKRAEDAMRLKIFGGGIRAKPKEQRIVDEGELPDLLGQGFEIVTVLPSGKLVVKQ